MPPRPLSLAPRLRAIADRVPSGARVADIGSDHARLPVYLLERGITERVMAVDLRPGPLESAARTAAAHRLTGRLELRLGDGLSVLDPREADVLVIAGMGGDTIIQILKNAEWAKTKLLLLQPMTRAERLMNFLLANGYSAPETELISEGRRTYTLFVVQGEEK